MHLPSDVVHAECFELLPLFAGQAVQRTKVSQVLNAATVHGLQMQLGNENTSTAGTAARLRPSARGLLTGKGGKRREGSSAMLPLKSMTRAPTMLRCEHWCCKSCASSARQHCRHHLAPDADIDRQAGRAGSAGWPQVAAEQATFPRGRRWAVSYCTCLHAIPQLAAGLT